MIRYDQNNPTPTGRELELLLAPVGVEKFLAEYADRKALLIKGDPKRFEFLGFTRDVFFESADRFERSIDRLKVSLKGKEQESEAYEQIYPFQARRLYANGMTICAAGISDANPRLAAFAEGVRYALNIPDLRFNSYLSPNDSGFNLHYDVQAIFLMQMEGRKRWWYGAEQISPLPEVYSSQYPHKPELDELEHCVLEPGDMLYLPAYTWHRARADGFSLGITLGTKGLHNQPLLGAIEASPFSGAWPYQSSQPPVQAGNGEAVPAGARGYLSAQLAAFKEHVAALSEEDLWQAWMREVNQPKGPLIPPRPVNLMRNTRLQVNSLFTVSLFPGKAAGEVDVLHAGHQLTLPADQANWVRTLLAHQPVFQAGEFPKLVGATELEWLDYEHLLRKLVAMHVVQVTG